MNQAVGHFGQVVEKEMEDAESNATRNKKGRSADRAAQNAREQVLKRFGIMTDDNMNRQFADPAAMF